MTSLENNHSQPPISVISTYGSSLVELYSKSPAGSSWYGGAHMSFLPSTRSKGRPSSGRCCSSAIFAAVHARSASRVVTRMLPKCKSPCTMLYAWRYRSPWSTLRKARLPRYLGSRWYAGTPGRGRLSPELANLEHGAVVEGGGEPQGVLEVWA